MAPAEELPRGVLDRIVARLAPEQIWLFGSRGRGDATPGSDWDVMVVLPEGADDELLDPARVWELCAQGSGVGIDIVPVSTREFAEMRTLAGSLCRTVALEGRQIYGDEVAPSPIVLGFLQAVREDADGARRLLVPPVNRLVGYHLQQAAEKLAKAVLSARGVHTTREHRLTVLAGMLAIGDPWRTRLEGLSHLDRFATSFRYPGTSGKLQPGPAAAEAQTDLDNIDGLLREAGAEVGIGR